MGLLGHVYVPDSTLSALEREAHAFTVRAGVALSPDNAVAAPLDVASPCIVVSTVGLPLAFPARWLEPLLDGALAPPAPTASVAC